jgi:hypothetical protein
MNNKCASCKSFYEPIQKPNGKYYKSCNRCLKKSQTNREKIEKIDNTIDNTNDDITTDTINDETKTTDNIITNNNDNNDTINIDNNDNIITINDDIIDEYLNIIKFKNSIIEKLTTDNKNLNNIVNNYKETLSQQQQQQPTTKPNIKNDDRLEQMLKIMMKK